MDPPLEYTECKDRPRERTVRKDRTRGYTKRKGPPWERTEHKGPRTVHKDPLIISRHNWCRSAHKDSNERVPFHNKEPNRTQLG